MSHANQPNTYSLAKRFDPHAEDTKRMMALLNMQFKAGFKAFNFFPFLRKYMPWTEIDKSFFEMKHMMRELIKEHMADVDYDSPRDFIDVYLKQIQEDGIRFDIDNLVVICLDFFQAGAETTRYISVLNHNKVFQRISLKCLINVRVQIIIQGGKF